MTTPRGSLITFNALDCGHAVKCYSLEPTPLSCHDCMNKGRKLIADITQQIGGVDVDELPSTDDLDEWLDECGVTDPDMRKDIAAVADRCDDVRGALDSAEAFARRILAKYPMVEGAQRA